MIGLTNVNKLYEIFETFILKLHATRPANYVPILFGISY